ncbi:hypothetical protein CLSAP_24110 [Clostridium saccharoperbutylacetonicum]|uniref:O-antigen ligase n=2 Tax=Clostridium saccharoperbutylacetonicum TaxID=36745 RepID=UPI000983AD56|nr:O-antigen ligase [Clostridium saccharoperbutylacetonicum]AQR95097.1 hypothetical protein CLSAP_24110 [Clostridium saccharoperbutylacetonicum]NSB30944.1 hypothetical protein [Clostridium saccharoperbutylacetonicum]
MKNIVVYILIFIALLEVKFFYVVSLPSILNTFNTYNNKMLILLFVIIGVIFAFLHELKFKIKKRVFNIEVISFFIIYIIQVFISCVKYDQDFIEVFKASYFFLIPLLYYVLGYFLESEIKYKKLIKIIVLFSSVLSFLFIVQAIIYENFGIIFLRLEELSGNRFLMRNDRIRLIQPALIISFSIILSWAELLKLEKRNNKILHFYNIILGLIYLILVCQTRMLTLSILVSMTTIILVKRKGNLKQIALIILLAILMLVIYNLDFTKSFIKEFNLDSSTGSVYARQEGLDYYLKKIEDNPISPVGLLNEGDGIDVHNLERSYILHGKQGYLFVSDVGIVGLTATLGIAGSIWFVFFIVKLLRILIYIRKNNKLEDFLELVGITAFILVNIFTLIITDMERIMSLPVALAIFEYSYISCNGKFTKLNNFS